MGDGEGDLAAALDMAALCETFHVLPDAGGLLDQDPRNIRILKAVHNARVERYNLDHPPGKK